jgi:hypothetical protein
MPAAQASDPAPPSTSSAALPMRDWSGCRSGRRHSPEARWRKPGRSSQSVRSCSWPPCRSAW